MPMLKPVGRYLVFFWFYIHLQPTSSDSVQEGKEVGISIREDLLAITFVHHIEYLKSSGDVMGIHTSGLADSCKQKNIPLFILLAQTRLT